MGPSTRTLRHAAALALACLLASMIIAGNAGAQSATASGCTGITLTPASKKVRPGGRVLLEGHSCGATAASSNTAPVALKIRNGRRWKGFAQLTPDSSGEFSACVRINASRRVKKVTLQAVGPDGTATTTLAVSPKGSRSCPATEDVSSDAGTQSGDSTYQPPPPDQGDPECPLSQPNSAIGLTLPASCSVVASDTASNPDPAFFWEWIECETSSRHQQVTSGGDTHQTGLGGSQGNSAFRRLTVYDGDDYAGERCELGHNNMNAPTAFYHEGQRRVTFMSIRMPANSPISDPRWRNVMQMKQAQPYTNPNPASIFEMQVRGSRWEVGSNWEGVWSTPATQNTWTRFAFDIVYSQDPAVGSIKIYVDLNGDGDANDANEESPRVFKDTLRVETSPAHPDGVGAGNSIPSHLRAGIYQDSSYSCPSGCSVDIDNVQVVRP